MSFLLAQVSLATSKGGSTSGLPDSDASTTTSNPTSLLPWLMTGRFLNRDTTFHTASVDHAIEYRIYAYPVTSLS